MLGLSQVTAPPPPPHLQKFVIRSLVNQTTMTSIRGQHINNLGGKEGGGISIRENGCIRKCEKDITVGLKDCCCRVIFSVCEERPKHPM